MEAPVVILNRFGSSAILGSIAHIAQLVEHLICNQTVVGSIPAVGSSDISEIQRRLPRAATKQCLNHFL